MLILKIFFYLELQNSHYLQTTHIFLLKNCSARPVFLPTGRNILRKSLQITEFRNSKCFTNLSGYYVAEPGHPNREKRIWEKLEPRVFLHTRCYTRVSGTEWSESAASPKRILGIYFFNNFSNSFFRFFDVIKCFIAALFCLLFVSSSFVHKKPLRLLFL